MHSSFLYGRSVSSVLQVTGGVWVEENNSNPCSKWARKKTGTWFDHFSLVQQVLWTKCTQEGLAETSFSLKIREGCLKKLTLRYNVRMELEWGCRRKTDLSRKKHHPKERRVKRAGWYVGVHVVIWESANVSDFNMAWLQMNKELPGGWSWTRDWAMGKQASTWQEWEGYSTNWLYWLCSDHCFLFCP